MKKIKFVVESIRNVTFKEKKTLKLKMFVMRNNLFRTDWMEQLQLWDTPINSFCQKIQNSTAQANKLKEELKGTFPEDFSS